MITRNHGATYDAMLYHLGIVNLANYFSVIKGVITINPSFGHSYSDLYHLAALNIFKFSGETIQYILIVPSLTILLGFILLIIIHFFTTDFFSNLKSSFLDNKLFFYGTIILAILVFWYDQSDIDVSLRSPDSTLYFGEYVTLFYFLLFLKESNEKNLFQLMILILLLLFIKLSTLVFVLMIATLSTIVWFNKKQHAKPYVMYASFIFMLFVPFILLSVIKTGTLLFPVSFLDLGLAWSNKYEVILNKSYVLLHARSHDMSLSHGWVWFPQWLRNNKRIIKFFFNGYVILAVLYVFSLVINKDRALIKKSMSYVSILILCMIPMLLYWFFVTLAFRMVGILFLLPLIILGSLICIQIFHKNSLSVLFEGSLRLKERNFRLCLILFLCVSTVLQYEKKPLMEDTMLADYEDIAITSHMYDGVKVFMPVEGDQCGYREKDELPCVAYKINESYTFKDPQKWWKGIYKRDY